MAFTKIAAAGIGSTGTVILENLTIVGVLSGSGSGLTGVSTSFVSSIGIQSGGVTVGTGITQLNFIGVGNTFAVNGSTVDISIATSKLVISTRSGIAVTISSGGNLGVIARSGTINVPV